MRLYIFGNTADEEYSTLYGLGYRGSINDMQFNYLNDQGYFGALADKLYSYFETPIINPGSFSSAFSSAFDLA